MIIGYHQIMEVDTQLGLPTLTSSDAGQSAICADSQLVFNWNGLLWLPSNRVVVKRAAAAVNGLSATGATKIMTLEPSAMNFYPVLVVARLASLTGTVTTMPAVSVGTNSTAYNNIASSNVLNSALALLTIGTGATQMAGSSPAIAGGTDVYAKVNTAAIGPSAITVLYDLIGYYM